VDYKRLCRLCVTASITGVLDFLHRPVFGKLESTTFRKLAMFPTSGAWETLFVLRLLELTTNTVQVFLTRLRKETRPVSDTLCFLVFRIPDDGQSPTPY
jgi:hypothetical protein